MFIALSKDHHYILIIDVISINCFKISTTNNLDDIFIISISIQVYAESLKSSGKYEALTTAEFPNTHAVCTDDCITSILKIVINW
eukprot:2723396-Ditylum_brightwellii.AAC.1